MNAAALFVQPPKMMLNNGGIISAPQNFGHPKLTIIMAHLQYEFGNYKYTVYRCAAKIITLQKIFYTSNVPYKVLLAVLERHGLHDVEANLMVPPFQLSSLVRDVYFACEQLGHFSKFASYQLDLATEILSSFFWNVFDPTRRHSVSVLEIKITFLLLCRTQASDEILTELYKLVSDAKTKCVSKLSFFHLLTTLIKFINYIGEGVSYGAHNTPMVMEQCFARCQNPEGLTEQQFNSLWTTTRSRFLIYANLVALVKRLEDTEKLVHNNVCASCHAEKIIGMRFKCQACTNLSLCLKCFATGFASNKHETGHRMFEVFSDDLPPKKFTHYLAKLCNFFHFTSRNSEDERKGFCNTNEEAAAFDNDTELMSIAIEPSTIAVAGAPTDLEVNAAQAKQRIQQREILTARHLHKIEPTSLTGLTTTATNATNVSERLQSLIDRLLQQNIKLEKQLQLVQTSTPEEISDFLSSHQQFLVGMINDMRNFSQISNFAQQSYPTSSTPNRFLCPTKSNILDSFSSAAVGSLGGSNLTHSLYGAEINRSYLEANKSDYSLNDLSVWFHTHRRLSLPTQPPLSVLQEVNSPRGANELVAELRETEMSNFKILLHKVKEIIDDSYSDNTELAAATQNLENVLDGIIQKEEIRRRST